MKKNKTNLNAIDQRIYKYRQALYLAFYSARLYIDVAKRWRGFGLIYFLLVIAIAAVPVSIKTMQKFNSYFNQQLLEPLKEIPNFEVVHGKLVFKYFMPYLIKNKQGEAIIVIDDKSNLTEVNYVYPNWMLFVTSDRAYFHPPGLTILNARNAPLPTSVSTKNLTMQTFEDIQYEAFNGPDWITTTGLSTTKWYFIFAIYPVLVGLMYGFFTLLLSFMALMGQVFARTVLRLKIDFKHTCRLMLVSSSCGVSLFIVSLSFGAIPTMGACFIVLVTLYFSYAIITLKRESKAMVLA